MKQMMKKFILVLIVVLILGCAQSENLEYLFKIEQWREERVERLTRPTGWLSLAGLFWLQPGANRFGADSSNQIVFPKDKIAPFAGEFILAENQIKIKVRPGVKITTNGQAVSEMVLLTDADSAATILEAGVLSWFIIKRGEKFGVRLRDRENPVLAEFKGIDSYEIDPDWRIQARLAPYDPPKTVSIPTVLGTIVEEPCPGALVFELKGKTLQLDPIGEPGADYYFLIFGDETNGDETYGAGRFLYVDKPDSNGIVWLDFNKAYNPPCAFTEFATCPLPPAQNRLSVKITVGEKKYGDGRH